MRTAAAACLAVALAAGCTDDSEPSPPPEPVDSLTDDTSEEPPPDTDTETETDDQTETTSEPPPDDVQETTEAAGAPELPPEASEQTEAGADAFVRYYVRVLNYGAMSADDSLLTDLGLPECSTCASFEQMLSSLASEQTTSDGPVLEVARSSAELTATGAGIDTTLTQLNPAAINSQGAIVSESRAPQEARFLFELEWMETEWVITSID